MVSEKHRFHGNSGRYSNYNVLLFLLGQAPVQAARKATKHQRPRQLARNGASHHFFLLPPVESSTLSLKAFLLLSSKLAP